jgi:hypothetical protein
MGRKRQRKDFTPSEAVAIKRDARKRLRAAGERRRPSARARPQGERRSRRPQPTTRSPSFTGMERETLRKAEAVVDGGRGARKNSAICRPKWTQRQGQRGAQKADRARGESRDRDGAAAAADERERVRDLVDRFPWAAEMDRDQASIDAAGRAFRPYPEMSIKTVCQFAREQIAPHLPTLSASGFG